MIFTFSTKNSKPKDTKLIEDIKTLCERQQINFNGIVVQQLSKWHRKQIDGSTTKIQDSKSSS